MLHMAVPYVNDRATDRGNREIARTTLVELVDEGRDDVKGVTLSTTKAIGATDNAGGGGRTNFGTTTPASSLRPDFPKATITLKLVRNPISRPKVSRHRTERSLIRNEDIPARSFNIQPVTEQSPFALERVP